MVGDVNWSHEPGDDLVGDVNQVEASVVNIGMPIDENTNDVDCSFSKRSFLNNFLKIVTFLFHYVPRFCLQNIYPHFTRHSPTATLLQEL